jgi:hypothetical protein
MSARIGCLTQTDKNAMTTNQPKRNFPLLLNALPPAWHLRAGPLPNSSGQVAQALVWAKLPLRWTNVK